MNNGKEAEADEAWIESRMAGLLRETPDILIATFNAEHEATDHVRFEEFWEKRYRANRQAWRIQENAKRLAEEQRQAAIAIEIEREFVEKFNQNYLVYINGKKVDRIKRLSDLEKCPACGAAVKDRVPGGAHEAYDALHGDPSQLPWKHERYGTCPGCKQGLNYLFMVVP